MVDRDFLGVDVVNWVYRAIDKNRDGLKWNKAWIQSYKEAGGNSSSGEKGCPMKAAETLYKMGRIRDGDIPFRDYSIPEIWKDSKNGTYALISLRLLNDHPDLNLTDLWDEIKTVVRNEAGEEPAQSNQGGPTLAYKLWHLGLIVEAPAK